MEMETIAIYVVCSAILIASSAIILKLFVVPIRYSFTAVVAYFSKRERAYITTPSSI